MCVWGGGGEGGCMCHCVRGGGSVCGGGQYVCEGDSVCVVEVSMCVMGGSVCGGGRVCGGGQYVCGGG